jgi:hypothetical protein
VPEGIHRELEDTPEDIKTVFRIAQTREEARELEHGDYIALYSSDSNGRNEHRWIKMGRYDEIEGKVRVEYSFNYETATRKLGAKLNFTARDPDKANPKAVEIPENLYEEASESLHEAL